MNDEAPMRKFVSPEYKSRCMDWAIAIAKPGEKPQNIINTAAAFYEFVYGKE